MASLLVFSRWVSRFWIDTTVPQFGQAGSGFDVCAAGAEPEPDESAGCCVACSEAALSSSDAP